MYLYQTMQSREFCSLIQAHKVVQLVSELRQRLLAEDRTSHAFHVTSEGYISTKGQAQIHGKSCLR